MPLYSGAWSTVMSEFCQNNLDSVECGCLNRKIKGQPTNEPYEKLTEVAPHVGDACWFVHCRPG